MEATDSSGVGWRRSWWCRARWWSWLCRDWGRSWWCRDWWRSWWCRDWWWSWLCRAWRWCWWCRSNGRSRQRWGIWECLTGSQRTGEVSEQLRRPSSRSYLIIEEWLLFVCRIPTPTPMATATRTTTTTTKTATIMRIHRITDFGIAWPAECSVDFSLVTLTSGNDFL